MKKIILKTAAIGLAVAIGLIAVFAAVFSFAYPQGMAEMFESFGSYSIAASYRALRYSYTGDIVDICLAVNDGARAGSDAKIIKNCEKLFADDELDAYYADNAYAVQNYYIFYASALYRTERRDDAVKVAADALLRDKNVPCALGALARLSSEKGDKDTAEKLLKLVPDENGLDEEQKTYFKAIKSVLTKI